MAAELVPDVLERILIGFDVKELIPFKRVCKSWYAFISSPRFIKTHLDLTLNNQHNNVEVGHVRILMGWLPHGVTRYEDQYDSYLLGSSNGLVCMSTSNAEILVANPLTNQVKKLQDNDQIRDFESLCWGFGYDSSIDDYKVIVGLRKCVHDHRICFHVLTLKSNVWKVIGEVKYRFISRVGTLCNGVLHWFMYDQNNERVILSLRLSEEELKEFPQPGDLLYSMYHSIEMKLGIMDECLCIFKNERLRPGNRIWKLKNHNGRQYWGKVEIHTKLETLYCVRRLLDGGVLNGNILFDDCISLSDQILAGAPIFVPSLVSPHDGCKKLIKGDPSGRDQRPTFDIVKGAKMRAHRCMDLLFL